MICYIFLRNPRAFGLKGVKRVDMNIFTVAIIAYTCSSTTTTTTCVLVQKMRACLLVVTSLLKIKLNNKIRIENALWKADRSARVIASLVRP